MSSTQEDYTDFSSYQHFVSSASEPKISALQAHTPHFTFLKNLI